MTSITAIYGGGFKPPQKGHFKVVEKALSLFPEIDNFKIYVGSGIRDGITQEDSIKVWEIYKNYLSDKVEIESSQSPIGGIMKYAKNHPNEKIYFVLGAREGKEEDFKDIESRTKNVTEKYPNVEIKLIFTTDPEISGTNARKALEYYVDFFKYLPDNLSKEDKEKIYNILKNKNLKENNTLDEYKNQETLNPIVFDGFEIKPEVRERLVKIGKFFWEEMEIPYPYEDIILLGSSANYNWTPYSDIDLHILVDYSKFPNPEIFKKYFSEVKSNWNKSHQLKINDHYIELYVQGIDEPNAAEGIYSLLEDKWIKQPIYGEVFIPDSEIDKKADPYKKEIDDILISPSLGEINSLQKRIKNFRKTGLESEGEYSIENLAFKELRNSGYIEKLIKAKNELIDAELLKEKDQNLTENATYSNFIDYKQHIKDLTKHMLQSGENISPLPKVIFKHSDSENAKNFLGKTGYYNQDTMEIVLYTEGRHPKDIVRSFAHEMVHHVQNLENRLENITTTNTNEDSDLENIEKEAYLNGNILFRKWTDSINEVGEGTAGIYNWKEQDQDDNVVFVEFTTDQDTIYYVQLIYMENSKALDIEFIVKDEEGNRSYRTITNKGELYKVMATISDIMKHYLKKFKDANTIRYSPAKKSGEDNSQRDLLYRAFISKLVPNVKFRQKDDAILATTSDSVPFSSYLNEDSKDYFGLNRIIKELTPELKKSSSSFFIYCDMDGVLCDFDSRVKELFNKSPKQFSQKELIEAVNSKGVEFWSKMKWIEGGQELWSIISKYNPSLLTSPGSFQYAPEGKKIWVQENLSPPPKGIIFRPVRDKYTVLNDKSEKEIKKSILIDDYSPNVTPWKQKGGIGILHKSFEKTESILNKFKL